MVAYSDTELLRQKIAKLEEQVLLYRGASRNPEDIKLISELRAENEQLRADAERYRWLKSRKGLTLRSDNSIWYDADGERFINTHYLAEGDTQHAVGKSLDEIIDKAMALRGE